MSSFYLFLYPASICISQFIYILARQGTTAKSATPQLAEMSKQVEVHKNKRSLMESARKGFVYPTINIKY